MAKKITKVQTGKIFETSAIEHLKKQGYEILELNVHTRLGEVDIIAKKDNIVAFIEVRSRLENFMVSPFDSITTRKSSRTMNAAAQLMEQREYPPHIVFRLDVLEVVYRSSDNPTIVRMNYIEGAYET